MIKQPEAVVAMCRCTKTRQQYGVQFQRKGADAWNTVWAFAISASSAAFEGYTETEIKGAIDNDPGYNGCLCCRDDGFTVCGKCGKLNCGALDTGDMFNCAWCGNRGKVTFVETLTFNAGGNY